MSLYNYATELLEHNPIEHVNVIKPFRWTWKKFVLMLELVQKCKNYTIFMLQCTRKLPFALKWPILAASIKGEIFISSKNVL